MANYANLIQQINASIKTNGANLITGQMLQTILDNMVASLGAKYQYAGVATPATNPGTPDQNVFYLAATAGTYTNFGGLVVAEGEVAALKYNGAWAKDTTGAATADQVSQLGQQVIYDVTAINKQYLTQGSLYNGSLDVSQLMYVSSLLFYRVSPKSIISYKGQHNDEIPTCRYSFYDKNKTWISQTNYILNDTQVPDNAYYCRFSFGFTSNTAPSDINDMEISVSAKDDYNPRVNNGGAAVGAIYGTGKINFDNVNKKVVITGGYLSFIKDGKRLFLEENTYIEYGTKTSVSFAQSVFLVVDGNNNLRFVNPSTNSPGTGYDTNIILFADCIVLAVIHNITESVIKYESIEFCVTRYMIDGVDYELVKLPQMFAISNTLLMQGGLYSGSVLSDTKKVYTPAKYMCKGNDYLYIRVNNENFNGVRIVWYNVSGTAFSNTNYSNDMLRLVPDNAYYFQLAFDFSTDTTPSDIAYGDISCSILTEQPLGLNNDANIVLPFYGGYLNFDNVNQKIQVLGGTIGYIQGNVIKSIAQNSEFNYPANLTPSSGTSHYLIINDNNEITTKIINGVPTNLLAIKKANVLGTIVLSEPFKVRKEDVKFCSIPFTIDGNIDIDYSILKTYSSYFNVENAVDSFLFFTDPHIFNNGFVELKDNKYIKAIRDYYYATPTSHCICGGDWMNHFDDEGEAVKVLGYIDGYMNENFKNYIPIVGNHDYNKYQAGHTKLGNQSIINLWYRNIGKTYFHIENKATDSRFYFFDSGIDNDYSMMDAHKWEQVNWLATELLDNVGHNILFVHISYVTDFLTPFVDNLTALSNAYNNRTTITLNDVAYDFSGCSGSVHCVISGHKHEDGSYTANSIPVVITADLRKSNIPTFDLGVVDYTAQKLYMVRVGSGSSREINII